MAGVKTLKDLTLPLPFLPSLYFLALLESVPHSWLKAGGRKVMGKDWSQGEVKKLDIPSHGWHSSERINSL